MNLIKLVKNHIRDFDDGSSSAVTPRYSIQSVEIESGLSRDLSTVVFFLFFGIFWLGMENYTDIIQSIIDFLRRR